jgi:hypothetical protein
MSNYTPSSIYPNEPNSITDVMFANPDGIHASSMARQAIINGNFNVWQRGTSFNNPSTPQFTADRYFNSSNADGGVFPTTVTHSQLTLTPGDIANSYYGYRINYSDAGSGFGVNSSYGIFQRIEYGTRLLCGAGKKIALSFWARSSVSNKKIGVSVSQRYGSGGSPSGNELLGGSTFTLTSNWTRYTAVFNTNTLTGKTFGTSNNDYLQIGLLVMWGATSGGTFGLTGTEGFGAAGNVDIAQVQVCAGSEAIPFSPRLVPEELELCHRYFRVGGFSAFGRWDSATAAQVFSQFDVPMRVAPTISLNTTTPTFSEVGVTNRTGSGSTITGQNTSETGFQVFVNGFTGATAGNMAAVLSNPFNIDAEL